MSTPSSAVPATTKEQRAWYWYDWANSAFVTVIGTFVFSTYFAQGVATDPTTGTGQWSLAMAAAGILALVEPAFWLGQPRTQVGKFAHRGNISSEPSLSAIASVEMLTVMRVRSTGVGGVIRKRWTPGTTHSDAGRAGGSVQDPRRTRRSSSMKIASASRSSVGRRSMASLIAWSRYLHADNPAASANRQAAPP